jgi:hypothetical protein
VFQPPLLSCPYFARVSSKTDDGCHARPRPLFQGGDLVDFGQDEHGPFAIRLTEHGWKPCDVNALAPAKTNRVVSLVHCEGCVETTHVVSEKGITDLRLLSARKVGLPDAL